MRGLNRVCGEPLDRKWADWKFIDMLPELRQELRSVAPIVKSLCVQDLQNCLCEFDKFERTLHGEGKPKALYAPQGQ